MEMKFKNIRIYTHAKKVKYLGINHIKHLRMLKILNDDEKIKEYLNKQRDRLCPRIGRLDEVKMLVLSKLIYRLNIICIKTQHKDFWRQR